MMKLLASTSAGPSDDVEMDVHRVTLVVGEQRFDIVPRTDIGGTGLAISAHDGRLEVEPRASNVIIVRERN